MKPKYIDKTNTDFFNMMYNTCRNMTPFKICSILFFTLLIFFNILLQKRWVDRACKMPYNNNNNNKCLIKKDTILKNLKVNRFDNFFKNHSKTLYF